MSLDSKAGIFLSALAVIGTVWLQIIPIKEVFILFSQDLTDTYCYIIVGMLVLTIIMFIVTMVFFLRCLSLREYSSVNVDSVISKGQGEEEYDIYVEAIIEHFKEIVLHNASINQEKAAYLQKSIKLLAFYIALSITVFIIVSFLI